ncbi:hypothetical protein CASFOL_030609 [Castilleja foliolosa]|uniref:Uncharacterized protein n=1 Tax=Castilleja foliolosa TaxID=1961234 RepID=A0ABD3C5T4_9LAMI
MKWIPDGTEELLCPAYLRMEDLLEGLNELQCSHATIEVTSLEETIKEMKNSSTNKSNDILFRGLGAPR